MLHEAGEAGTLSVSNTSWSRQLHIWQQQVDSQAGGRNAASYSQANSEFLRMNINGEQGRHQEKHFVAFSGGVYTPLSVG